MGHSQCHCVGQSSVLPDPGRSAGSCLAALAGPGFVTQTTADTKTHHRHPARPRSRSVTSALDRLESHRGPALAPLRKRRMCNDFSSFSSLPIQYTSVGIIRIYLPTYLGIDKVGSMVHRSPVGAGTLARPVRTSRPWIPRRYPGYFVVSSAVGRPVLPIYSPHLPVTFPLRSATPSTVPTGRRGLLSPTPTAS